MSETALFLSRLEWAAFRKVRSAIQARAAHLYLHRSSDSDLDNGGGSITAALISKDALKTTTGKYKMMPASDPKQ